MCLGPVDAKWAKNMYWEYLIDAELEGERIDRTTDENSGNEMR